MIINLDLIKDHLNLERDFTEQDEYLMMLSDVAVQAVEKEVGESVEEICQAGGAFPAPLLQACLLFIGNLYQNREVLGSSAKSMELPKNFQYLIDLYKNYNK